MNSILHIRPQQAVYLGNFGLTTEHRHGALVLLLGLSGHFNVQLRGQTMVRCRSALIDAGTAHIVDCQSEDMATLYFEVNSLQGRTLRANFLRNDAAVFDIANLDQCHKGFEQRALNADLSALIRYSLKADINSYDRRVASCIQLMQQKDEYPWRQDELSARIGLSNSRLNHLFKQHTGISFRHFSLWSRLAIFMRDVHNTRNITHSALNSGFSDSAHLSNSYKKIFGIRPSAILSGLKEFHLYS
ncbi:helix-turn-helix domain-containing protein [Thalassolituus sp. C2-1]|uniref:helix-turn-helix transcriptional regulator n=1 Tax=Venatorbacter sp. C2-1 TaxID=2597518 RepID=UPI00119178E2|nr:helix-turn-helix domain-containing protein [Thalassolituus sp. C2-1]TVV42142.1 helix-turn-helix domain-containing protein [Thalassolituus sp. C2-1]